MVAAGVLSESFAISGADALLSCVRAALVLAILNSRITSSASSVLSAFVGR